MMPRRITRRQAITEALAATATGALLASCGGGNTARTGSGSTLESTWVDPLGVGALSRGPGEPLLARTDLGPRAHHEQPLATLVHITDAHVLDASSPARVPFLARLGPPFQSTFRPHETLTTQVLAGAIRSINRLRPDAVIQGGDLIDNAQSNELTNALNVLERGVIGQPPYYGVQLADNADPFYYRPDLDAPRHPGLLQRATHPFRSPGLTRKTTTFPVLGDHDILVQGEIAPTTETRALATGNRALWELPPGLQLPKQQEALLANSPDGPITPTLVNGFLAQALAAPKKPVPADRARSEMDAGEVVARLSQGRIEPTLDYAADIGQGLRLIVLDLARRAGGSGGLVRPDQPAWLTQELRAANDKWIIAVSHQPLAGSEGGEQLLSLLDQHPRVIAALSGHTHRNQITARPTQTGGYWLINTASLIDYPQQARALRVMATEGGGVAIQTWMLDHVFPGDLGSISRELAYLDAQGGRPNNFIGARLDRNVTLFRASV